MGSRRAASSIINMQGRRGSRDKKKQRRNREKKGKNLRKTLAFFCQPNPTSSTLSLLFFFLLSLSVQSPSLSKTRRPLSLFPSRFNNSGSQLRPPCTTSSPPVDSPPRQTSQQQLRRKQRRTTPSTATLPCTYRRPFRPPQATIFDATTTTRTISISSTLRC